MDIRRVYLSIHSVRELSHTKVPWAEVGKVGPQGFAEFFAAERPLPSSPITRPGPSEKSPASGMPATLTSHWTCRSRSGLFKGLVRHPLCLKLYQVKSCKWLVGTQSYHDNTGSYIFHLVDSISKMLTGASKRRPTATREASITYGTRNNTLSIS